MDYGDGTVHMKLTLPNLEDRNVVSDKPKLKITKYISSRKQVSPTTGVFFSSYSTNLANSETIIK